MTRITANRIVNGGQNMAKKYFIGTSGWNYPHWKDKFYPSDILKKNWFNYYCENFNTVEINYSFYQWPAKDTLKKWFDESPADFKFTVKAPRTITHIKKLVDSRQYVDRFYALTKVLKRKMGCHLFQLPPSFSKTSRNLEKLKEFLEALDARKDNAVEFRHRDWWSKEIFDLLKEHKITFCVVAGLKMPEDIVYTYDTSYFRFHGDNYASEYSRDTLKNYARSINDFRGKKVYAYFNNDMNAYAPHNALQLKNQLEKA